MFENTLLIIKSDYMSRRKCLLLHLLSKDFQIQGNRKLAFTPEDAAEFYKDLADDKCYMLYVILLSKGTSEAFILTKYNGVEDLLNIMVCYFGTSVEMDRNIHISRTNEAARREITFIFPNYIHEPIQCFDKYKFCKQPLTAPFLGEVYDIVQKTANDPTENWRTKLSEWLIKTNATLPHVSNQCSQRPQIGFTNAEQQTDETRKPKDDEVTGAPSQTSSRESTGLITSSSCISCSSFEQEEKDVCQVPAPDIVEFEARVKERATKTLQEPCKKKSGEVGDKPICDEHIEWINVYEYEDGGEGEEEQQEECKTIIGRMEEIKLEVSKVEVIGDVSYSVIAEMSMMEMEQMEEGGGGDQPAEVEEAPTQPEEPAADVPPAEAPTPQEKQAEVPEPEAEAPANEENNEPTKEDGPQAEPEPEAE